LDEGCPQGDHSPAGKAKMVRIRFGKALWIGAVSTWYRKNQIPTIPTLDKVCRGLGITLSQFFAEGDEAVSLTPDQKELLDNWSALTEEQQKLFIELFKSIP